jgi:hypothetical protein
MNNELSGRQLAYARIGWVVFALILLALQIAGQVAAFHQAQNFSLPSAQIQELADMGLSLRFYATFRFLLQLPIPIIWGSLAILIFWQKSRERSALILSAVMLGIGTAISIPTWQAFAAAYPAWVWIVPLAALVGNLCINSFFLVFPTGRFVPRWTLGLAIAWSVYNILNSYQFALPAFWIAVGKDLEWVFPLFIITSLAGIFLPPVYRYRRISTPIEREQTKWVIFTIVIAMILLLVTTSTIFLIPNSVPGENISFITVFVQPIGWAMFFVLISIGIAVSILRYRLFDIDVIIRKTLQYGVLSALLALVYFGSVVLLQTLFGPVMGDSPLLLVLSTLLIAAIFSPLRRRVQDLIDRSFYRKKYDAAQVLARFAQTAQEEVEMEKLLAALVGVVEETIKPQTVSLWLVRSETPGRIHHGD